MKKILLKIFVHVFVIFTIICVVEKPAYAFEEKADQYCLVLSQAYVTIGTYNWNQTFTPSLNMLTKVRVFLKDRVYGNSITITIKDIVQSNTIYTSTKHMGDGDGWEEFPLAYGTHPDGYELVKENKYAIYLSAGNTTTSWHRSGADASVYPGGERRQNDIGYSDDFVFSTWGYEITEEEPDGENIPPDELPETGEEEGNQTENNTKKTDEINIETDDTIEVPTLDYVEKNEEKFPAPITESIEVNNNDSFKIAGTAKANAKVLIYFGEDVYEVNVDETGKWILDVDVSNIQEGECSIEAQTQVNETQGSEKTVLFPLSKVPLLLTNGSIEWPVPEHKDKTLFEKITIGEYRLYSIIGLSTALVLLIGSWLYIVWKREKKLKKGDTLESKLSQDKPTFKESFEKVKNTPEGNKENNIQKGDDLSKDTN